MTIFVAPAASNSRSWLTNTTVFLVARAAPRAIAWPGRRGSCPARRARGCRPRRAGGTRVRVASARRRSTCGAGVPRRRRDRCRAPGRRPRPTGPRRRTRRHRPTRRARSRTSSDRRGCSAASSSRCAASTIRAGDSDSRSDRTVSPRVRRAIPTSCRITPSRPSIDTVPLVAVCSPVRIRSSDDLPTPFAPTSATRSPFPTENETSRNSSSPLGSFHPSPEIWIEDTADDATASSVGRRRGFRGRSARSVRSGRA